MPIHEMTSSAASSSWFTKLRWFAFFGQAAVLATAVLEFKLTLPWLEIAALLLVIPITNVFGGSFVKSERTLIGCLLALDTVILTGVLSLAGGPMNPFTIVYLLHVVLAAVVLGSTWTWSIAALSTLGFMSLFPLARAIPEWEHHGAHEGFSLHLHGMLLAYTTVSALTAYFLNRIVKELRQKDLKLQRLESLAENQRRLASLTTMTAGAAHELGTPLATIALVSHELEQSLLRKFPDKDLLEDVSLLKEQTLRCKQVIQDMSGKSGDLVGEIPQTLSAEALLQDAIAASSSQGDISLSGASHTRLERIPRRALATALGAIIKNAREASAGAPITIDMRVENDHFCCRITDQGVGMDPEVLEHLGEPFYSTKGDGKGMGLGVYLARLTFEQLGGDLSFHSKSGKGTTALARWPLSIQLASRVAA